MLTSIAQKIANLVVWSLSVYFSTVSLLFGSLGDNEPQIISKYGRVVKRAKSLYGLASTEHLYANTYKIVVVYRAGRSVEEILSKVTQPTIISDTEIITHLVCLEPGDGWVRQPNSDDCEQWSKPGARASYELDTDEHCFRIFAVEGKGASERILAMPGAAPKPPQPLSLLKFKKDRFAGTERISFQQPIRVTPSMTLDLLAVRPEGQKDFSNRW